MAFKMKGFHMPGIAGVKAEVDKINELSGITQKVMKVKPKDEFSTIASRKKIYDSRYGEAQGDEVYVAPGATLGDKKRGDEHEANKTPLEMLGGKFYGDRSMKDMRKDIQAERRTLKDGGGTREEVKAFNAYQTLTKKGIRADELDSRGRTKRANRKRSNAKDAFDKKRSNALDKIEAERIKENKEAIDSFGTKKSALKHGDGSGVSTAGEQRNKLQSEYADKHGSSSGGSDEEWKDYQAKLKSITD